MADARGGSFSDISSHEMTRPPSPAISRAGSPGETGRALRRDPTISSATASLVPSDRVMHHRSFLAWCSATPIRHTRPCRTILSSFLPEFLARRRSWDLRPSQVCSRIRVARHLCRSGPTCRSCRAFAPIDFRRVPGSEPCAFALLRLLGFAPVCDPIPGLRSRGSILPWALPLAGFRARFCACVGLDPDRIISLRDPAPACSRTARPYPLVGLRRV
jgi:hypothetical protein